MYRRIVIYSSFVSRILHDDDAVRCRVHRSIIRITADIPYAHRLLPLRPLVCHPERSFSGRSHESSRVLVSAGIREIVPFPVRSLYESSNCGTFVLVGELGCRFAPLHDEVGPRTPAKCLQAVTHCPKGVSLARDYPLFLGRSAYLCKLARSKIRLAGDTLAVGPSTYAVAHVKANATRPNEALRILRRGCWSASSSLQNDPWERTHRRVRNDRSLVSRGLSRSMTQDHLQDDT